MSTEREFSAHYLARAGHPSVDLIADALAVEDYDTVGRLVEQLHGEMCAMLYGYLAWPKVIRNNVQASQGEHAWQELDVVARQSLPSDGLLPRSQTAQRLEFEIEEEFVHSSGSPMLIQLLIVYQLYFFSYQRTK